MSDGGSLRDSLDPRIKRLTRERDEAQQGWASETRVVTQFRARAIEAEAEVERLRDIIARAARLNQQAGAQGMVQAVLREAS